MGRNGGAPFSVSTKRLILGLLLDFGLYLLSVRSFTTPDNVSIALVYSTACPPCTIGTDGYAHRSVARMIANEINDDPNVLPNTRLLLKHYDTQGDPGRASMAMAQAVLDGADGIVGGFHSACSKPMATVGKFYHMPQISGGSTNDLLGDKDLYPYFLRTVAGDGKIVPVMSEVVRQMGWSRVATLSTEDDFATSAINEFERVAVSSGISIVTSASYAFVGSVEEAKAALRQIRDSGARVVVAFLTSADFDTVFRAAYELQMTGDDALIWVVPTAEVYYPDDQGEVFHSVTKGLIGVQPFLGGGPTYDMWNARWRSMPTCDEPGCDDPFEETSDSTRYTLSNRNLSYIPYGAYYADALLTLVYAMDDLISRGVLMCHSARDENPCNDNIAAGSLLGFDYSNATCFVSNPCVDALHRRLRTFGELQIEGLTGVLAFSNTTNDRILQYEVRNWRATEDGGSKFVASYDQTTATFTPNLREIANGGGILFNGGGVAIPTDMTGDGSSDAESVMHFVIIPIGGVIAVGAAMFALLRTKQTMDILVSLMRRTIILIASLTFELTDIVSDVLVLTVIITSDDEDVKKLIVWYGLFVGCGTCLFCFHVLVNGVYLFRMFTHSTREDYRSLVDQVRSREKRRKVRHRMERLKGSARVAPREDDVAAAMKRANSERSFERKLAFVQQAHECSIAEAQVYRIIALFGLFLLEDLPMGILNVILISMDGCDDDGSVRPVVLFSLIVGTLMVAFKLSQISNLASVLHTLDQGHMRCVEILVELDELD